MTSSNKIGQVYILSYPSSLGENENGVLPSCTHFLTEVWVAFSLLFAWKNTVSQIAEKLRVGFLKRTFDW